MNYLLVFVIIISFLPSSLLAGDTGPFSPLTFDEGIEFVHPNDLLKTRLQFRMQNRIMLNTNEGSDGSVDSMEWKTRRLRLKFGGYVYRPEFKYNIQLSFSRNDQDFDETGFPHIIRDATFIYKLNENWEFSFGQSKLPGNRQRLISSRDLQFVDRSLVNSTFNLDRDFGLQSFYHRETDRFGDYRWNLALSGGEGRNADSSDAGFAVTTRFEWLPLGSFEGGEEYVEGDMSGHENFRLALAFGASRNENSYQKKVFHDTPLQDKRDVSAYFADLIMKYRGWSLLAEYFSRNLEQTPFVTDINNNSTYIYEGEGFNIQSGFFVDQKEEIAFRYSLVLPHEVIEQYEAKHQQYSLAYSYYFKGHSLKFQSDLSYDYRRLLNFLKA